MFILKSPCGPNSALLRPHQTQTGGHTMGDRKTLIIAAAIAAIAIIGYFLWVGNETVAPTAPEATTTAPK